MQDLLRSKRSLWFIIPSTMLGVAVWLLSPIYEALNNQTLDEYEQKPIGSVVVPVIRSIGDFAVNSSAILNNFASMSWLEKVIGLCICLFIFGVLLFLWDNLLIRLGLNNLIKREHKLIIAEGSARTELQSAKLEINKKELELHSLSTEITDIKASKDRLQTELSSYQAQYNPVNEPTYIQLEFSDGNWMFLKSNNVASFKILYSFKSSDWIELAPLHKLSESKESHADDFIRFRFLPKITDSKGKIVFLFNILFEKPVHKRDDYYGYKVLLNDGSYVGEVKMNREGGGIKNFEDDYENKVATFSFAMQNIETVGRLTFKFNREAIDMQL